MAQSKPINKTTPTWFNFFSAGFGGIVAWVIIHPFNTGYYFSSFLFFSCYFILFYFVLIFFKY